MVPLADGVRKLSPPPVLRVGHEQGTPRRVRTDEGILHVAEAHIRDCWSEVSGVEKLNELRDRSPEELVALAERLVDEYASNEAVEDLVLQRAMKTGDVGLMEDLLPHLFFRFCGGGNHKYAVEILELLQGLHKEWTKT